MKHVGSAEKWAEAIKPFLNGTQERADWAEDFLTRMAEIEAKRQVSFRAKFPNPAAILYPNG